MATAIAAGIGPELASFAMVQSPELRRLVDYWLGLRQGRPMPARRDVDPIAIPWALTRIYLIDYDAGSRSFRYRLAGDEICRLFGRASLKGLALADFMPAQTASDVESRWMALVRKPSLMHMEGMVYLPVGRVMTGERVMLPLSERGDGQVTGLIGMTVCEWHGRERPARPQRAKTTHIPVSALG